MKTKFGTLFGMLAVALVCFAVPASAISIFIPISNIVKNGGFESGNFSHWSVGGNTGGAANANTRNNGAFGVDQDSAHSGDFGAFAGPSGSLGFLGQDVRTVAGSTYDLSFWMDGNQSEAFSATSSSDQPVEFEVFWNGSLLLRTFDPPSTFTHFSFTDLLATRSSTDLRFGFRDDFGTFHLDDVRVGLSRVPEALSTLWLALPLLLLLAFARHQGKQIRLRPGLR